MFFECKFMMLTFWRAKIGHSVVRLRISTVVQKKQSMSTSEKMNEGANTAPRKGTSGSQN